MSDRSEAEEVWSTTVVQIAFEQPFLLQGILALAALHMASLNSPEKQRLSITVASNKMLAYENRSQLEHITRQNCDAIFASSILTDYYIPASEVQSINPSAT